MGRGRERKIKMVPMEMAAVNQHTGREPLEHPWCRLNTGHGPWSHTTITHTHTLMLAVLVTAQQSCGGFQALPHPNRRVNCFQIWIIMEMKSTVKDSQRPNIVTLSPHHTLRKIANYTLFFQSCYIQTWSSIDANAIIRYLSDTVLIYSKVRCIIPPAHWDAMGSVQFSS